MSIKTESIAVNGTPMQVLVSNPPGRGPHPAIVLMCHITGLDEFTRNRCEELAAAGYVAVAPDPFHYHEWIEDRPERFASLRDTRIVNDVQATLDHLSSMETVDMERLGIMGHCMGGRTALLACGAIPRFAAMVIYYGGRNKVSWGEGLPTPFEIIARLKCPVIGFFGNQDQQPAPADVDEIEAEMKRNGVPHEFHRYENAGHAFQDHTAPNRYNKPAADDAWQKTLAFLKSRLE